MLEQGAISDVDFFARVARAKNIRAAGREIGLSDASVKKRINALESRVGAQLFIRKAQALNLTEVGKSYFERVLDILRQVEEADTAIGRRSSLAADHSPKAYSEACRIARILGLRQWQSFDDVTLAAEVRDGLPASAVALAFSKVGLESPEYIHALIPKATYSRKLKAQKLSRSESERLFSVAKVFVQVLRVYREDRPDAQRFLTRAHPMLAGRSPFQLAAESAAGSDSVLNLLLRADAGVAV